MRLFNRKNEKDISCLEENTRRHLRREIKIGVFVFIALLIMAVFIFIVGDLSTLFRKKGYPLFVRFDSVAGLEKKTVVRIAGIRVGYVRDIRLKGTQAEVELSIDPNVKVKKGARATLAALGLLGEKYIEILPGAEDVYSQPGDSIQGVTAASFDQLGSMLLDVGDEIKRIGESLQSLIGEGETQNRFKETLGNLSSFTADLKDFMGRNRQSLDQNMRRTTDVIAKIDRRVDDVSLNLDELITALRDTVEENRGSVKGNLDNIRELVTKVEESLELLNESLEKINRGDGSLGKLIHQTDLYDKAEEAVGNVQRTVRPLTSLRMSIGLRADYYGESDLVKNSLSLSVWPTADQFLLSQIVHDPWENRFTYSLQGGLRWGPFSPRAGILESSFGAAVDYYALDDHLVLSLEGFDFNRDPRPQFRFLTRIAATRHLSFLVGVEDFALAPSREFFFGLRLGLK